MSETDLTSTLLPGVHDYRAGADGTLLHATDCRTCPSPMKTWEDIERAALYEPVLHEAVTLVRAGVITQLEAMIAAALALTKIKASQHDQLVDYLMRSPASAALNSPRS